MGWSLLSKRVLRPAVFYWGQFSEPAAQCYWGPPEMHALRLYLDHQVKIWHGVPRSEFEPALWVI
jgi:hypothetical protein